MIALATATTIASIGLLTDSTMYGGSGDVLMVIVGVLSLVVSLVTSGLNYSGRSRNMFVNYRKIQALSARAERAAQDPSTHTQEFVEAIHKRYDAYLDESENHTPADHLRRTPGNRLKPAVLREDVLTLLPYATLALPASLLARFLNSVFHLF